MKNENLKNLVQKLLHDKNIFSVIYFIKDLSLLKDYRFDHINIEKIGMSRRLSLYFHISTLKDYTYLKNVSLKETNFINCCIDENLLKINFLSNPMYNGKIDMIVNSITRECLSNQRIFDFLKLL